MSGRGFFNYTEYSRYVMVFVVLFFISGIFYNIAFAASDAVSAASYTLNTMWSGQIKQEFALTWPDRRSFCAFFGSGPNYDADLNLRLKNTTYLTDNIYWIIHYESVVKGGDMYNKQRKAEHGYFVSDFSSVSGLSSDTGFSSGNEDELYGFLISRNTINDKRRFFDFTKIIEKRNSYTVYHRLDRFSLTFSPQWGVIRIGRQAVTWGNGIVFNPMDLFNPFAPTDVDRDYKVGDDMIYTQIPLQNTGDVQFLYVPRRSGRNNNVTYSASSVAGKLHISCGTTEFDFMAAHHYEDFVAGFGSTGYFMDAAWRINATWTFSGDTHEANSALSLKSSAIKHETAFELHQELPVKNHNFVSFVANADYSWNWLGKNIYGFMEFYFNGAGNDDPSAAMADPEIIRRLERGDMFFPGRKYFAAGTQVEINPLVNFYFTVIHNIHDRSSVIQPRLMWDISENIRLTFGADLYYGGNGSEFGGFRMKNTSCIYKPFNNFYSRFVYFF